MDPIVQRQDEPDSRVFRSKRWLEGEPEALVAADDAVFDIREAEHMTSHVVGHVAEKAVALEG